MSTLRLSELVAQAMGDHTIDGRCDVTAARSALVERLTDEHRERAVNDFAARMINQAASKVMKGFAVASPTQGVLPFRLHGAYPIRPEGDEGTRIVSTYEMSRMEAMAALKVRRAQIEADTRSADDLQVAIEAAAPFWDRDPALSFGAALEAATAAHAEAFRKRARGSAGRKVAG